MSSTYEKEILNKVCVIPVKQESIPTNGTVPALDTRIREYDDIKA
ncbi:MAG: hypothetical protein V3U78_04810 [Thiotrichaceae bacterium]